MEFDPQSLRLQFLRHGVRTANELAVAAKVSQPTISRALKQFSDSLVRIGRGRLARYALSAPLEGLGDNWPLYIISQDGSPEQIGNLHPLLGGKFWIERTTSRWNSLFDDLFPDNVFPDLPWFLDDLRPQGFLGRAFARKHAAALGLEQNPAGWSSRAVLEAMLRFGEDFHGAFVLGVNSLRDALASHPTRVIRDQREQEYPRLAERALKGDLVGSSAGGEQPKFVVEEESSEGIKPLIVKFSPPLDEPIGRRWADLLHAEHLAGGVLREHGYTAARSKILDAGNRRFLEVERFDRTCDGGRIPVISLRALASALLDVFAAPWPEMASALLRKNWLNKTQADELAAIWRFGKLIANTDMHDGNISLLPSPEKPARLAPVYDMLPMAYRPDNVSGQIPALSQTQLDAEKSIPFPKERKMAKMFWERVADSLQVSPEFRGIAKAHATSLENASSPLQAR